MADLSVTYSRSLVRKIGFSFAWGALQAFAVVICLGIGIAAVLQPFWPTDDSDYSAFDRSGMRPRVDALTGCQYLETSDGAITPRLGRDGRQICR